MDGSRIIKKYDNKNSPDIKSTGCFCLPYFFTRTHSSRKCAAPSSSLFPATNFAACFTSSSAFSIAAEMPAACSMEISFSLSPIARTFSNCIPSFSQSIHSAFPLEALVEFSSIMPSPLRRNAMPGMGLPFSRSFCARLSVKI